MHSARWNSRASYILLAYFLIPAWRCELESATTFIANQWKKLWFSKQLFDDKSYDYMLDALTEIKCTAALKCFMKHWSKEDSVVHIPRANIIAQRGIDGRSSSKFKKMGLYKCEIYWKE